MNKYRMTVHEALSELKVLGSRIEKELASNAYILCNKHANTKIDGVTIADANEQMKASLQRVTDLINRRNAIKRAVTISNATTNVTLSKDNGSTITMTVAELIEYRNVGITYLEKLLNTLSTQYNAVISSVKRHNDSICSDADRYVTQLFGNKDGLSEDVIENTRKAYIDVNTYDTLDPNKVLAKISELQAELDFYNTKVDAALSTSNAITVIEFEL